MQKRARLNTRVDAVSDMPADVQYVIKGKVVEVDPGNSKLRAISGFASAIFGGGGGGGGGAFRATGEIYRVQDGNLVRIADFERPLPGPTSVRAWSDETGRAWEPGYSAASALGRARPTP